MTRVSTKTTKAAAKPAASNIAIIPAVRRNRDYLDYEAVRIWRQVNGASKRKVESLLYAEARMLGASEEVAKADAAEAIDYIDIRIMLLAEAVKMPIDLHRWKRAG